MFSFENFIDLPLIWGGLIATGILLYVLLDGFDLGIGIMFPFAPTDRCRDRMMNSIAPFWDGNETWLVLGGGGLFAAFPLAYSIVMPALYIPIIIMLMGLILRGVAFEFRYKSLGTDKRIWDYTFHAGSLVAAFSQGLALGGFLNGFEIEGRNYDGGAFDWLTPFSLVTGVAVVFGYALIGSTWLIMKSTDNTQTWARKVSQYVLIYVALFLSIVSLCMPFMKPRLFELWFSTPNIYYLSLLPLVTTGLIVKAWRDIRSGAENSPFLLTVGIFLMSFVGLGISMWPWVVPYELTIYDAAAAPESLSLLLVGTIFLLPMILGYTAYCYYVFRGKSPDEATY